MSKTRCFTGISEAKIAPLLARDFSKEERQTLIVVSSETRAKRLCGDLSFFVREIEGVAEEEAPIYVLPDENEAVFAYEARNRDALFSRLAALKALREGKKGFFIAPAGAVMKRLAPTEAFEEKKLLLEIGCEIDPEAVREALHDMGYERTATVEAPGEYSVRGDILDIFTPDADEPYRVEFFDTEVDSIRRFDIASQRSIENLKSIVLYPAQQIVRGTELFESAKEKIKKAYNDEIERLKKLAERDGDGKSPAKGREKDEDDATETGPAERAENLAKRRDHIIENIDNALNLQYLENYIHYFYEKPAWIWNYLAEDGRIAIDDPDRINDTLKLRQKELMSDFELLLERGSMIAEDIGAFPEPEEFYGIYAAGRDADVFTPFAGTKWTRIDSKRAVLLDEVENILCRQTPKFSGRMDLFAEELKARLKEGYEVHIACRTEERRENLSEFIEHEGMISAVTGAGAVYLCTGELSQGIEFPEKKLCFISDADIFTDLRPKSAKRKKSKHKGNAIETFTDLREGDYVVHENHGIGKFLGIMQLTVENETKDYLKIQYAGADMLYVPVEQMDIVQKYVGAEGAAPKINRLSGGEWKKTKARAKAAVAEMAQELIELSAKRQIEPGFAFPPDDLWQREFEDSFPYAETEDQLRCIEEIKEDMEKPEAMDRLLCGDVGFGKTEVAARAIFKALSAGKQAAILVPTTILANQHYYTLRERFERFPFRVEVLSRFKSATEQKKTIERIASGACDLVIGTHRLLSKDVKFKDLGLLVIDEEQRFGVEHKETIKKLRANLDVLTLSATPIPRTLHMSLIGIKNMSVIEEPPEDRYPIQTYVMEQDEVVIREAVQRELSRGGQVYVVYNRVGGVGRVAQMIERLCPEAKVAVAHGRMGETELENTMMGFIDGESNVLVSTTIIETGIDIPNVNTVLILDADRYGLSQLYQLRGRVGRTNRIAYAYLMYTRDKVLTEIAEKRLRAIRDFTEFGAGFKVAMRDLEIRGAGNILGMAQSGHMNEVGYELYCKLVDDAVRALQGEIVNSEREEASIELRTSAYIPEYYISDEITKLHIYKRIAKLTTAEEAEDLTDELMDRFGDLPKETEDLIKISRIRSLAGRALVTRIYHNAGKIVLNFTQEGWAEFIRKAQGKPPLKGEVPPQGAEGKPPVKGEVPPQGAEGFPPGRKAHKYNPTSRIFVHGGVQAFIRYSPLSGSTLLDELIELLEELSA